MRSAVLVCTLFTAVKALATGGGIRNVPHSSFSPSTGVRPAASWPHQAPPPARLAKLAPVLGLAFFAHVCTAPPALADGDTEKFKFPPIDRNKKDRCTFVSSAMGQANAARDSLYDLRECQMGGKSAGGFDLSGALMANGDFKGTDFKDAQLSKVYGPDAVFDGADFTNAVVDRAFFKGSSFKGAKFINTVLTGTTFEGADVENADFTGSYIGQYDARRLCKNPTLQGTSAAGVDTRESAGC